MNDHSPDDHDFDSAELLTLTRDVGGGRGVMLLVGVFACGCVETRGFVDVTTGAAIPENEIDDIMLTIRADVMFLAQTLAVLRAQRGSAIPMMILVPPGRPEVLDS